MAYNDFMHRVSTMVKKVGGGLTVRFSSDSNKGIHIAKVSDGTTIIGNSTCMSVEVRWGSGHRAIAAI